MSTLGWHFFCGKPQRKVPVLGPVKLRNFGFLSHVLWIERSLFSTMKKYNLVVARLDSSDSVLVVPFEDSFDFGIRRFLNRAEFDTLIKKLGLDADELNAMLDASHSDPRSFELHLELSEPAIEHLHSCFPELAADLCSAV